MNAHTKYRILEIIPGAALWLTFILAFILSFFKPLWVIYFIIVYDLYWLIRIIYFLIHLLISFNQYRKVEKINWFKKVKDLGDWEKYYHLIILPTYKEGIKVFEDTLGGLANCDYDTKKFIVVLSRELRAGQEFTDQFKKDAEILHQKYDDKFHKFFTVLHPNPPADQIPGKGSNATWAVQKIQKEYIDPQGIPHKNIVVSNFDSDTHVYHQYFSRLMYLWLTANNPHRHSYQPLALYNNNLWDAPSFARVIANSTTFWLMADKARPERLFTFSSHSMSFKTLVEVGYWESDIVTEDSRIFLQCFDHFDGNYSTIPMHVPISMDTVLGKNVWGTIKGQYKQMRRWAWSVEHFPWMVTHFSRNKKIPWRKKIRYLFNQAEGTYSWATGPVFIMLLGRLPLWVASLRGDEIALVQNTPYVLEILMTLAMVGILCAGILNMYFIPRRPVGHKKHKWAYMVLQWFLLPLTMIFFGSLPALDAQTRLMLGGNFRLGFDVTFKHRK